MAEFIESAETVFRGVALTSLAVLWTVLLVRIVGLRSFSKMTSFDFVATIATGSLIAQAGTRANWTEFLQAMAAIGGVFLIQWLLATARKHHGAIARLISNSPVLLMEDGRLLKEAMAATRVSKASVIEKLRAANVDNFESVHAVVLETTGDISVIHGGTIDEKLLEGVRRIGTASR